MPESSPLADNSEWYIDGSGISLCLGDAPYEGRLRIASAMMESFLQFPAADSSIEECIAWLSGRQIPLDHCYILHPLDFLLCHITLSVLSPGLQEEFRKKCLWPFEELPRSAQVMDFLKDQDRFSPKLTVKKSSPLSVQASPGHIPTPSSHQPGPTTLLESKAVGVP